MLIYVLLSLFYMFMDVLGGILLFDMVFRCWFWIVLFGCVSVLRLFGVCFACEFVLYAVAYLRLPWFGRGLLWLTLCWLGLVSGLHFNVCCFICCSVVVARLDVFVFAIAWLFIDYYLTCCLVWTRALIV